MASQDSSTLGRSITSRTDREGPKSVNARSLHAVRAQNLHWRLHHHQHKAGCQEERLPRTLRGLADDHYTTRSNSPDPYHWTVSRLGDRSPLGRRFSTASGSRDRGEREGERGAGGGSSFRSQSSSNWWKSSPGSPRMARRNSALRATKMSQATQPGKLGHHTCSMNCLLKSSSQTFAAVSPLLGSPFSSSSSLMEGSTSDVEEPSREFTFVAVEHDVDEEPVPSFHSTVSGASFRAASTMLLGQRRSRSNSLTSPPPASALKQSSSNCSLEPVGEQEEGVRKVSDSTTITVDTELDGGSVVDMASCSSCQSRPRRVSFCSQAPVEIPVLPLSAGNRYQPLHSMQATKSPTSSENSAMSNLVRLTANGKSFAGRWLSSPPPPSPPSPDVGRLSSSDDLSKLPPRKGAPVQAPEPPSRWTSALVRYIQLRGDILLLARQPSHPARSILIKGARVAVCGSTVRVTPTTPEGGVALQFQTIAEAKYWAMRLEDVDDEEVMDSSWYRAKAWEEGDLFGQLIKEPLQACFSGVMSALIPGLARLNDRRL